MPCRQQYRACKGVFTWNDGSSTHRLAVKTDVVTNPDAKFDDHPSTATGATVTGAAVGALIGALLGGGKPANAPAAMEGQPVSELQNLIGSDPGYVESRLTGAGSPTSAPVHGRSILNRYQSFTYANSSNCN